MARGRFTLGRVAVRAIVIALGMSSSILPLPLALASGGGGCGGPITDARGSAVEIRQFCFTPTVLRAATGARVSFTNLDPVQHNVLGANGSWGSFQPMRFDRSTSYRFAEAGVFSYVCTLHPGMVGTVVVGPEVSARDGSSSAVASIDAGPARFVAEGGSGPAPDGWKAVAVAVPLVVVLTGLVLAERRRTG